MHNKNKNKKRNNILRMLLERVGGEVSGEFMSFELGISRAGIAKHIKNLRAQGFDVNARAGGGYTLGKVPDIIDEGLILAYGLSEAPVMVVESAGSTNILAKAWAEDDAEHGCMVVTKEQTSGRGRKDRRWQSVKGGIYSSVILRLTIKPKDVQPITLAAAAAVVAAIKLNDKKAQPLIKWPNDILIDGKKVCGILTEFSGDMDEIRFIVCGIGINSNFSASELEDGLLYSSTTLKDCGININNSKLIAAVRDNLLENIKQWDKAGSAKQIMEYYRKNMAFENETVRISGEDGDVTGVLMGVEDSGELILKTEKGELRLISGEISMKG